MPIPQLKSNFSRRRLGEDKPSFVYRQLEEVKKPKKIKSLGNFLFKKEKNKNRKGPWFWRFIRRFWRLGLALLFVVGIFMIGLFAWYSKDLPESGKIMDRSVALSTKIYDKTGEVLLYEVHGDQNRSLISINEIPDYVKTLPKGN